MKYDLLSVCETWLKDYEPNGELLYNTNDYVLVRCDRVGGRAGGGVCVFIKSNLCYKIVKISIEFSQSEII